MKRYGVLIIICIAVIGSVACAPYWLARADRPVQSDVIVLLLGPKSTLRKEEALKLIEDGHSRHLIIPAYGKVSDAGPFSNDTGELSVRPDPSIIRGRIVNRLSYPKYYEDTHIEILESRKMMDKAGFKSAIFVSSPYHMRRISIIAKKVFGKNDYQLIFVPSRFEQYNHTLWFLSKRDLKMVTSEYVKIAWFTLYRFFAIDNGQAIQTKK